jgi:hypothetical protein
MVPVPEEHVEQVMKFVVSLSERGRRQPEEAAPWDPDSIGELVRNSESRLRGVLSFLAQPENADREFPPRDLAAALSLRSEELAGLVGPLSRRAKAAGHPSPIQSRKATVAGPGGARRRQRVLVMPADVAEMVRAADATSG